MLPPQAIKDFKKMYKARYGVELSDAEAKRRANNLIDFYRAVCEPSHRSHLKTATRHNQGKEDQTTHEK